MGKMKLSISNQDGKSQSLEIEGSNAQLFTSKMIGDEIDGTAFGFQGTILKITGGSDKDGFPMRSDVHGGVKKAVLASSGVGFNIGREGKRRRKIVRGNVITDDIVQVNLKVLKK